jgi:hypothetical protein
LIRVLASVNAYHREEKQGSATFLVIAPDGVINFIGRVDFCRPRHH